MLLLDERIRADGAHARTWASWHAADAEHLQIQDDDGASGAISLRAVDHVMRRYGRPLEHGIASDGEALPCGDYRLRRLRYHALVDAEGRDYLVWVPPDGEPLACVASMVSAALRHLVLRIAAATSGI